MNKGHKFYQGWQVLLPVWTELYKGATSLNAKLELNLSKGGKFETKFSCAKLDARKFTALEIHN